MPVKVIPSTCKECSVRCGSLIHVDGEKVVRIEGNPAHPASRGAFCVIGVHAPVTARVHPDRPLHPMRRAGARGEGRWERISWQQAWDEIAQRMTAVKREHGALSLAGAVSNHFVSRGVAMTQLLRSLGSPNYMINQDLCQGARYTAALLTGAGAQPGNEMEKARCIHLVGKSPSDSSVVQWMNIKAAKKAGAQLIVVDPRRTPIARAADQWLPARPGTDAALALAMANVIIEEGLYDREFVDAWCAGLDTLRDRARQYAPAIASDITGIAADDIVRAARTFATVKPGCMVLGHGIDAQANGVRTAMAFHALLGLTGNIDRPGTNRPAKPLKGFRDYYSVINDAKFRLPREIEERIIGGDRYPLWCGPESWSKSSHNPSLIAAIHTGEPYPVKALYVSGVNIACTYPDIRSTVAALRKLDLLVVATDHMTPTAELADFVLPKTTLLEEEDVSADQGAPCLAVVQRALPPKGEAKSDMDIAVGLLDALRRHGAIEHDVFPWRSHREFVEYQMRDTGITFDALCREGFVPIAYGYEEYRKKGFRTPSGKLELASQRLAKLGLDPAPEYHAPAYAQRDPEFGLTLLTGIRSMAYHHSRFRNHAWARKLQDAPELRIHPRTAQRLGVAADDWIWVETPYRKGRALLQAWITEEVPEDIVATGMGWWFPEMRGADRGSLTYNIDVAVAYGPPWDPINGAPEARNTACKVTRAQPHEVPARATPSVAEVLQ
jgi:anaerobic selenocysteine-containing dehydrogenase